MFLLKLKMHLVSHYNAFPHENLRPLRSAQPWPHNCVQIKMKRFHSILNVVHLANNYLAAAPPMIDAIVPMDCSNLSSKCRSEYVAIIAAKSK